MEHHVKTLNIWQELGYFFNKIYIRKHETIDEILCGYFFLSESSNLLLLNKVTTSLLRFFDDGDR